MPSLTVKIAPTCTMTVPVWTKYNQNSPGCEGRASPNPKKTSPVPAETWAHLVNVHLPLHNKGPYCFLSATSSDPPSPPHRSVCSPFSKLLVLSCLLCLFLSSSSQEAKDPSLVTLWSLVVSPSAASTSPFSFTLIPTFQNSHETPLASSESFTLYLIKALGASWVLTHHPIS